MNADEKRAAARLTSVKTEPTTVFGFGHYVVDLARGAVRAGDRVLDLRPKTFLVLAYLVEHAGRLVPKDEIMQAVWPDVVVSDESLAKCISEIRIALGDQDQRLVKTVPRRGYLLDVPVSATNGAPRTALPEPAGEPAGTERRNAAPRPQSGEGWRRPRVALLAAALLLAALSRGRACRT